jgi:hypothetical protein
MKKDKDDYNLFHTYKQIAAMRTGGLTPIVYSEEDIENDNLGHYRRVASRGNFESFGDLYALTIKGLEYADGEKLYKGNIYVVVAQDIDKDGYFDFCEYDLLELAL